jgi:hypothetical protein
MTRQIVSLGATANDGTGDTLRTGGQKINDNFAELYTLLGDSSGVTSYLSFTDSGLDFNGTSFVTTLTAANPSAARVITLPDAAGTLITTSSTATLTNKTLTSPILTTPSFNDLSSNHRYNLITGELLGNRNIRLPVLADSDTFVFSQLTQTLTNKTLTTPILDTPRIHIAIDDSTGAEILRFSSTASAVNEVQIHNAATGNRPILSSVGDDTNVGLNINSKGTGSVVVSKLAVGDAGNVNTTTTAPLTGNYIRFNGTTATVTIPNGTVTGEIRIVTHDGASGIATIAFAAPANFAQGVSIALDVNDTVTLLWNNTTSEWNIIGGYGYTVS